MRISVRSYSIIVSLFFAITCTMWTQPSAGNESSLPESGAVVLRLHESWELSSGCAVKDTGDAISTLTYHPSRWMKTAVPSTVLAAQVEAGQFKDPFFGMNLRKIPGTTYPIGKDFNNLPMPADSPYTCPWWYRKSFAIPALQKGHTLWLRFDGINYRANIWLNGKKIADSKDVSGAYRTYEFNITANALVGKENVVAIEAFAPTERDLGINWVDWSPCPPDKDMGLTGAVNLISSGPVTLRAPLVTTHFSDASLGLAQLTVYGELQNATEHAVHGIVTASLLGMKLTQSFELGAGELKTVVFTPVQYPQLKVHNPQLW